MEGSQVPKGSSGTLSFSKLKCNSGSPLCSIPLRYKNPLESTGLLLVQTPTFPLTSEMWKRYSPAGWASNLTQLVALSFMAVNLSDAMGCFATVASKEPSHL